MKPNHRKAALVIAMMCASMPSLAQKPVDHGKLEYDAHCAICHGVSGRGDGEMRRYLTTRPSDLTTLSKRNGGAFPNQLVWDIIDGRGPADVAGHGTREMPIWGQRYRLEALAQLSTASEPEWYVRNRIVSLLDYLSRIQDK
jgi:mono/diheme cytochrome c family protein